MQPTPLTVLRRYHGIETPYDESKARGLGLLLWAKRPVTGIACLEETEEFGKASKDRREMSLERRRQVVRVADDRGVSRAPGWRLGTNHECGCAGAVVQSTAQSTNNPAWLHLLTVTDTVG
jgi:hypothetical protein